MTQLPTPPPRPASRIALRSRGPRLLLRLLLIGLALGSSLEAMAVLISTGDGTGNTSAPTQDPGFAHVGPVNGLTGVYVGNGWFLTANHVGEHPIELQGVSYDPVPGSKTRFSNPDQTLADLIAVKLRTRPPLPDLTLASSPPSLNSLVTMIGNGVNRGAATSWMGADGWEWGPGRTIRWGTNRISHVDQTSIDTRAFFMTFDDLRNPPGGQHEAGLSTGDSGGAVFLGSGGSAKLIGILFAQGTFQGQPTSTSLFGNLGMAADLYTYRSDLLDVIEQPDCDDGLDEDGDGLVDFPDDPGCSSASDSSERDEFLVCDNGVDDDGDGLTDVDGDPGCVDNLDSSERGAPFECDNGIDDDFDGSWDFPDDSGCLHPTNLVEAPEPGFSMALALGIAALAGLPRPRATDARGQGGQPRAR